MRDLPLPTLSIAELDVAWRLGALVLAWSCAWRRLRDGVAAAAHQGSLRRAPRY